jgi:uncharacterized protein (DUF169 family)
MSVNDYHALGEELERLLLLRGSPIAVKMLKKEEDIPEEAIRPKKDRGHHLAQCQAFAMSRRQGETVAMLKEDHWCFAPLMAYGLVTAPLKKASFEPDMVLVYAEPGQVRKLLMAVKFGDKSLVTSVFDPIDSCVWAVVPVIESGEYRITIPDPGEYARAATRDDMLIFSIPKDKLDTIVSSLKRIEERERKGPAFHQIEMRPDFPQPEFYQRLFKTWGLDTE